MKKFTFLTMMASIFLFAVIMLASCTKEGPAGSTGAIGPAGPTGEAGINGTDGTAGCIECHDGGTSQGIFAQAMQWQASKHATGGNFNRNTRDCATCHTSQGFRENLETGAGTASISDPNPINCYTCHDIHTTYTPADLGLTTSTAVTLMINSEVVDLGKGNLCATCHQNRVADPMPVLGGDSVVIAANSHWGIHYGAQGPMVGGTGGFEFGSGYTNSAHGTLIENTCVDCHMAEAIGDKAGGHTMKMTYLNYGRSVLNSATCTTVCHTDASALTTKIADTKTEIDGLEAELKALLITVGVFDADGDIIGQKMSATKAAAALNYYLIHYDGSHGVHNYLYAKTLLTNTIAELSK